MSLDQRWWTLTNPFCFSSDFQCQPGSSLVNFKEYEMKSFKEQGSLFATLILLWILQVCCGICPPMTSWSTCWLEKPCRHWLKLSSSPTQAGQTEITQNQVFYLTLISSTMPQDAWGKHSSSITQSSSADKTGLHNHFWVNTQSPSQAPVTSHANRWLGKGTYQYINVFSFQLLPEMLILSYHNLCLNWLESVLT